jgi:hypothetical protein
MFELQSINPCGSELIDETRSSFSQAEDGSEPRPMPHLTADAYSTIVRIHDSPDDCQPQIRPMPLTTTGFEAACGQISRRGLV